mgnify:CR=1 FL=1|tara:strand:- start:179 stop:493 length:315 start_codon:yes stop_codon:yes gene_type:complete
MDEHKEENKSYQSVINTLIISASILIAAFFLFKLTESISSMEASLNNLNSSLSRSIQASECAREIYDNEDFPYIDGKVPTYGQLINKYKLFYDLCYGQFGGRLP